MRFKVPLLLVLAVTLGISVAYAGVLHTFQFGGTVNVLVTGEGDVSGELYLDEACTQPLTEPIDFGSVYRGAQSERYIWLKNTGTTTWTISHFHSDNPYISATGCGLEVQTLAPGEVSWMVVNIYVRQDAPGGQQNLNISIEIVG